MLSPGRVELIVWLMALTTFAYVSLAISLSPLLTSISKTFGVSESAVGQLATIQGIVVTISALVSAPWMNRFPRRTWLRAELLLLCVGVAISALAPTFPVMIAARVIIGIAAGALIANCFTAASEVVRDPRRQGRAIGIVASGTTVATMAGLPAIAWIESVAGWRWALAILVLPLVLSLAGTTLLPSRPNGQRSEVDEEGSGENERGRVVANSLRRSGRDDHHSRHWNDFCCLHWLDHLLRRLCRKRVCRGSAPHRPAFPCGRLSRTDREFRGASAFPPSAGANGGVDRTRQHGIGVAGKRHHLSRP